MDSTICREVVVGAARGAEGAERDGGQGGGGRALADRVGDPEPRAAGVLDVVEPVAADVVAGQDVAGQGGAGDACDARRKRGLLDLGGGARVLAAAGEVEDVGVRARELERGGGLAGELGEWLVR